MSEMAAAAEIAVHPAIRAWRRLTGTAGRADRVDALKNEEKSAVYRLVGIGGGESLIAKRCEPQCARIERIVYEDVLPCLPLPSLRYYGSLDEGDICWLFLEDSQGVECLLDDADNQALAASWLANLHAAAAKVPKPPDFPGRGPADYLAELRAAQQTIRNSMGNPLLATDDSSVLESILRAGDALCQSWNRVADFCAEAPSTLVHCDFHGKNLHLRPGLLGPELVPLDWEYAGWGPPAVDLPEVDLRQYHRAIAHAWPSLSFPALQSIAEAGAVFQWVSAVNWAATHLPSRYVEKGMCRMRCYEAGIPQILMAAAGRRQ